MTIREIARRAGVSPSTVSLVFNGRPGVGAETRGRIEALLQQSGYQVRQPGEPGLLGDIRLIRYFADDHEGERNDEFYTGVLRGAEEAARSRGYTLSISNVDAATLPGAVEMVRSLGTKGVLFLASEFDTGRHPLLLRFPCPLVALDNAFFGCPVHTITTANAEGVDLALRHLHGLGHRTIGYLRGAVSIGGLPERWDSFRPALERLGLPFHAQYVWPIDLLYNDATHQMQACLEQGAPLPTAFFADNDVIAAGAMRALQRHGVGVPEQVSLVGFDDSMISRFSSPAITTVRVPRAAMGRMAVERLIAMLDAPPPAVVKSTIGVELVARESTAPPPARRH